MKVEPVGLQQQPAQGGQQFTNEQKRDELAREINIRKTVYPGVIRSGRLTHEQAERQTAILTAIWQEYVERAKQDRARVQPSLDLGEQKDPKTASQSQAAASVSPPAQKAEQRPANEPKAESEPKTIDKPAQPVEPEKTPASTIAAKAK
jgi:hypothetical protein